MNYLKNIVKFEVLAELNELPDKTYRLWYVLMSINNACGWIHEFKVPLKVLRSRLNTESKTTIYNARNQLVQLGLLEVTPGTNGSAAKYHLIPLVHDDGTNQYQDSVPSSVPDSVPAGVPSSDPLNKQNKTKQNKTNTSGKSGTSHKKAARKFAEDSVEMELALYLFGKIKQNNPEHKDLTESQKQKWADSIRLMIERDNRTPQKIRNMIDWCQADSFWKQNILSTAKLRKQYDAMRLKAKAEWERKGIPPSGSAKVADDPWFNRKKA
ncbi:hypothetical protein [Limosilactobacillus antri]|uniref:hypothetical protein n=1 Tax=Limosilactobacillus antri TaxID=227943 RepID=UPI001F5ACB28|nr:hypothetical protein [Limosilactobacillus antri]